jgi:hypothetical protein
MVSTGGAARGRIFKLLVEEGTVDAEQPGGVHLVVAWFMGTVYF